MIYPMTNEDFMHRAIELAKKGEGKTNPNPLVGAVLVKNGRIIGEGYHHAYGDLHAERDALKDCAERGENPSGATIFVTLEPCCHFGKQPPCTHALVEAGISHVFVGSRDPNPLVHGKGNSYLREHGITVTEDFLRQECDDLNPIFFHFIQTKLPFVSLKYAMTLDGKIATKTGESQWISNEKSRAFVHTLRNRHAAILAGIGTVLADNPLLNCRLHDKNGMSIGRNPLRIVCDSNLRIPIESQIVQTADKIKTIVACTAHSSSEKMHKLEQAGVEVIQIPASHAENLQTVTPHVDLLALMKILGERNIDSVLIEGGGEIHYSALASGIVNKIYAFVSPKIFGGMAKSPVGGEGRVHIADAFSFSLEKTSQFDDDLLLEYQKKA